MESLRKSRSTLLIFPMMGWLLFHASPLNAQVITAAAKITVTVIPPAGINFASAKTLTDPLQIQQSSDYAMTVQASSNVAVVLDSLGGRILLNIKNIGQGTTKIFTASNLKGVSKVEAIFLGN